MNFDGCRPPRAATPRTILPALSNNKSNRPTSVCVSNPTRYAAGSTYPEIGNTLQPMRSHFNVVCSSADAAASPSAVPRREHSNRLPAPARCQIRCPRAPRPGRPPPKKCLDLAAPYGRNTLRPKTTTSHTVHGLRAPGALGDISGLRRVVFTMHTSVAPQSSSNSIEINSPSFAPRHDSKFPKCVPAFPRQNRSEY